ncbi:MAG TPA: pyridoxamine 5'-phosphate oxidase family protein [Acidimicrobiales bacterium]|jgi:PPOX class probable F420-dependent enzyme|nr:pyridoxamine 5'-phosphate oxidase family protein [Acidimicrobiales bacterium]
MADPRASRPYMPGYGILGPEEGTGLLRWSWATERLAASHDYWLATTRPDGHPHVMPVWGTWQDGAVWFSSSGASRKTRNLTADPRAAITTDNALEPVVVEGTVERIVDRALIVAFAEAVNAKYSTDYSAEFFTDNACFRLRPAWVFGLAEGDFAGSPTRWIFPTGRGSA